MFINSIEKFTRNLRWRSHFFLKPPSNNNSKENYGFKSIAPAPQVKELKFFEDGLINLAKEIKFEYKHNQFQSKLNKDVKVIKNKQKNEIL